MPLVVFHPHHQIIAGDTGIIHQNRRRAELCGDLGQYGSHGLIAGHIQLKAGALHAVFLQGRGDTLGARGGSGGADHDGALTAQFQGDRLANATARAGNQCNFTLQTHAGFS
jgi:hypothetical protein